MFFNNWEKNMWHTWSDLSQNRDDLIVFLVRLRSRVFDIQKVVLTKEYTITLSFPGADEILFVDLIMYPRGDCHDNCYAAAQHEAAEKFWQTRVMTYRQHLQMPYSPDVVNDWAETIAAHFGATYSFVPETVAMDIVPLLPGAPSLWDWDGSRHRITRLTPSEILRRQTRFPK
jgi:hypothetical protein